ncbi:MafI family immunity protein, partial [Promicromonospora sp. NPDC057488]|uniref:MafI family immunity protein n=1 Tax=Promicromonospora sp. NPDC057488 TaxID=3346147 RepID=UPI00366DAE0D
VGHRGVLLCVDNVYAQQHTSLAYVPSGTRALPGRGPLAVRRGHAMQEHERHRALISGLLVDSPLTSDSVINDVHHLMVVGEESLAFDTMCSWIYEDALEISERFYARLVAAAGVLGSMRSVEKLDEIVAK